MEELPTGNHRRNASAVMGANLVLRNLDSGFLKVRICFLY